MALFGWIWAHIEAVGIVSSLFFSSASLIFTGLTYRKDEQSRQLENFFAINEAHRDIWTEIYKRPDLDRVLQTKIDLKTESLKEEEKIFVNLLILHLNTTFRAMKTGLFKTRQPIEEDIRSFFALPIPRAVWEALKPMREPDFVQFVEGALREENN